MASSLDAWNADHDRGCACVSTMLDSNSTTIVVENSTKFLCGIFLSREKISYFGKFAVFKLTCI